jgi:hypothetical protein
MSNAAAELKVAPSRDPKVKIIESERSSLDSYHDNTSSRNHPIINNLYNNKTTYTDEDIFVKYIETKTIPEEYYVNRNERLENRLRGFFTTRMECLVNKKPLHFKNSPNTSLTFVYDQGPHPVNYFEKAVNGMFISDAVDTAPKLTKSSQRPVLFTTPQNIITLPGSYIGFNESIVRSVVFSDFKGGVDQVQCKVIIEASLGGEKFRWFDLSQKFDAGKTNNLIGYTLLSDAIRSAKYKESNSRNTGFFIGNANAKKLLENQSLKPIVALCIVVAKVLGDFSSALASSPRITTQYTGATKLYGGRGQISNPDIIIHASGDRLCSLEASRQGGNSIKTFPRNSDGIIHIQYTPGTSANIKIDYKQRFNTIHTEIIQRFNDLLVDLNAFSIYKYKVDGNVVSDQNKQKLDFYTKALSSKITSAMGIIKSHINTITGDDRTKYETLYREKIRLMPQAPLISTPIKDGYRKNLSTKFHIYRLPDNLGLVLNLRDDVNKIMKSNTGGKRKLRSKRLRRTLRRLRGGQNPTKEIALKLFDDLRYTIRERMLNFALSTDTIDYDSKQPDVLIQQLDYIKPKNISINKFIELVKENKHEVNDPEEIEWAKQFTVKDEDEDEEPPSKIPKLDGKIYVPDYDEEFMKEVEEAINQMHYQIEQNTEDADYMALIESIPNEIVDYIPPPTDATMSDNVVSDSETINSLADSNTVSEDETSTSANTKEKVPSTPSSRASTPNSEPQTLPINRSVPTSDTEFSQGGRKRKTYRRIKLF